MLARLFRDLEAYQPTLVGTYPLGLQVDGSDLDIACSCDDLEAFEQALIGFRMLRIDRDAFTPAAGYPPDLRVDGIRLLDRAWLDVIW